MGWLKHCGAPSAESSWQHKGRVACVRQALWTWSLRQGFWCRWFVEGEAWDGGRGAREGGEGVRENVVSASLALAWCPGTLGSNHMAELSLSEAGACLLDTPPPSVGHQSAWAAP